MADAVGAEKLLAAFADTGGRFGLGIISSFLD